MIDAPERRQDFSNRAKQFVSDLVFGKQVRIVKQDIDRYGRIVGIVYVGDVCVNEELVRNGLAWVYRRYCVTPICAGWFELETQARDGRRDCGHTLIRWHHGNIVGTNLPNRYAFERKLCQWGRPSVCLPHRYDSSRGIEFLIFSDRRPFTLFSSNLG
jgi:hypothetical protein